jgi:hypothetical protein
MNQIRQDELTVERKQERNMLMVINMLSPVEAQNQLLRQKKEVEQHKAEHTLQRKLTISRQMPNLNAVNTFQRLIEEDQVRTMQYDRMILEKVKEPEANKKVVFSGLQDLNPKHHFLKGCIDEADLALPLMDKVKGKTLLL